VKDRRTPLASQHGLIAKHLGMFVERRQLLGEDGQPTGPHFSPCRLPVFRRVRETGPASEPEKQSVSRGIACSSPAAERLAIETAGRGRASGTYLHLKENESGERGRSLRPRPSRSPASEAQGEANQCEAQ